MPSAISAAQPEPFGGISQTSRPRWAKRSGSTHSLRCAERSSTSSQVASRDGLGHRALVEAWPALARRSAGACGRDREACSAARLPAAATATSPARARAASGAPRGRRPRRRSRPGRSRGRARGRARACRSAAARSAQARTAPGDGARARPELLDHPLRHAHRRAAGAVEPVQLAAVPHEREGIAPDAVVGRLADGQAGGRGQRRVDRVAALLERPHAGARRGGVARRHERAAHDRRHPRKTTAGEAARGRTGRRSRSSCRRQHGPIAHPCRCSRSASRTRRPTCSRCSRIASRAPSASRSRIAVEDLMVVRDRALGAALGPERVLTAVTDRVVERADDLDERVVAGRARDRDVEGGVVLDDPLAPCHALFHQRQPALDLADRARRGPHRRQRRDLGLEDVARLDRVDAATRIRGRAFGMRATSCVRARGTMPTRDRPRTSTAPMPSSAASASRSTLRLTWSCSLSSRSAGSSSSGAPAAAISSSSWSETSMGRLRRRTGRATRGGACRAGGKSSLPERRVRAPR